MVVSFELTLVAVEEEGGEGGMGKRRKRRGD